MFWGPPLRPIELFPRKKANLFESGFKVKALLPADFPAIPKGYSEELKRLETSFFPDLNTKRTVTAFVCADIEGKWKPATGKEVFFRLGDGGPAKAKLNIKKGTTDSDGCIELEIEHPAETPKSPGLIFLQASFDEQFQSYVQLNLSIRRNDDTAMDLGQVVEGRSLLVHQKSNKVESEGVKRLQDLLNQVVARKKSATDFSFLETHSKYDDDCKKAVKTFIDKFGGGFDYPKGKFNVKVNDLVKEYIKKEYGAYEDGQVVDRSLLIGTKQWAAGDAINTIDGLLDIYTGVVERFFAEMLKLAEEYTSCNTFWLHRPIHRQYTQGEVRRVVLKETVDLRAAAGDGEALVKDKGNNNEKANKGDDLQVVSDSKVDLKKWFKVRVLDKVQGWVSDDDADLSGVKVNITNSTTLKSGYAAGSGAVKDSRGNSVDVASGATGKKLQGKQEAGKWWYKIELDPVEGWLSEDSGKLVSGNSKFEVTKAATVLDKGESAGAAVRDWGGSSVSAAKGEKFAYLSKKTPPNERWFKVENKNGVSGWVKEAKCTVISNDRATAHNAGTFGMAGVAYSYGSKDRPADFTASLQANKLSPAQIDCWHLYENTHKPGKTSNDSDTANWTGIDCSGFTQDTVTYTLLADNQRIVPEARMKRIGRVAGATGEEWPWTNCIPAKNFVGDWARQIAYDAGNANKQWLQCTDIITTAGHIVWVGDRDPDAISNHRDFQVYNAYGGDSRQNQSPSVPTDKFIRKIIQMPFKWWGIHLGDSGVKVGRIYFWS